MAYDGVFLKKELEELKEILLNERINKINVLSKSSVSFLIRKNGKNLSLILDANPNFPYVNIVDDEKNNMKVPSGFCMLLRKYFESGIIRDIVQVGKDAKLNGEVLIDESFERIVRFSIEDVTDGGDIKTCYIFFEIMGKYSNIIVTDENLIIIDTLLKNKNENERLKQKNVYNIKHIANKYNILKDDYEIFKSRIFSVKELNSLNGEDFDVINAICKMYEGLSRQLVLSTFLLYINENNKKYSVHYDISELEDFRTFFTYLQKSIDKPLDPVINYKDGKPSDFYIYPLIQYEGDIVHFKSISSLLSKYINDKYSNINENVDKKALEDIIKALYSKFYKKIDIYNEDISKCDDMEKYKKYAELVSSYGYNKKNIVENNLVCVDFDGTKYSIPIDISISISKNVEKYYNIYNKLKRTKENALKLLEEVREKIEHLESIESSVHISNDEKDLYLIKEELARYFDEARGFTSIKKHEEDTARRKKHKNVSINYNISEYKSSSGIIIYVGKNNIQNEYLTFDMASSYDTWFHVKGSKGAHVILKARYEDVDDKTLVEAAGLAAYYSDRKDDTKVTVDYTYRKELKKVKGKAPGFCIYHKNYSINVKPTLLIK